MKMAEEAHISSIETMARIPPFFKTRLRDGTCGVSTGSTARPLVLRCAKSDHNELFRFIRDCPRHGHTLIVCYSYLAYLDQLLDPLTIKNDRHESNKLGLRANFIMAEARLRYGIIREKAHAAAMLALYGEDALLGCTESQIDIYTSRAPGLFGDREARIRLQSRLMIFPEIANDWTLGILERSGPDCKKWVASPAFLFPQTALALRYLNTEVFQYGIRYLNNQVSENPKHYISLGKFKKTQANFARMQEIERRSRLLSVVKQDLGEAAREEVKAWAELNTDLKHHLKIRDLALGLVDSFATPW